MFSCAHCDIQSLSTNFGTCTTSFQRMHLYSGINRRMADIIFRYPYFQAFTSLHLIGLMGLPLTNMANLKLPPSLTQWIVGFAGITTFPNLTSHFPNLKKINLARNNIKVILNHIWKDVFNKLQLFNVNRNGLSTMVDFTIKPNLREIDISHNHLETVPDLLNMTYLTKLKIAGNTRMSCDHRMCWRRLWDRMRAPFASSDDVMCVQPPELAGYNLSVVNPKLMEYGKCRFSSLYRVFAGQSKLMNQCLRFDMKTITYMYIIGGYYLNF